MPPAASTMETHKRSRAKASVDPRQVGLIAYQCQLATGTVDKSPPGWDIRSNWFVCGPSDLLGSSQFSHPRGFFMPTELVHTITTAASMTSKEVAEILGKRHWQVLRDIDNLIKTFPTFAEFVEPGVYGSTPIYEGYRQFILSREAAFFLMARKDPSRLLTVVQKLGQTSTDLFSILTALEAFDVPPELGDMYVYAIREVDTGHIKLGISRDPSRRLETLQVGNSHPLELVAYTKAGSREDEIDLHDKAKAYRLRGEWFSVESLPGVLKSF